MTTARRIESIDIMRGLTLLLMLFVNDLNMEVAPAWLGHTVAEYDGMGLADWVFPGFLFMVGMAVPFAISGRLKKGESIPSILGHIITRTVSLLVIGVMMVNIRRSNPELTGMSINLWAVLMYVSAFLIWNDYPKEKNPILVNLLKYGGVALMIFLALIFQSGTESEPGWLITDWWGILGMIGWGYLVTSLLYLAFRDSVAGAAAAVLFFLALNILDLSGMLGFLDPLRPALGIIIAGNTPLIVVTGLLAGVLLKKLKGADDSRILLIFTILGVVSLALGFFLRRWFIISKLIGTPSWAMICSGISFLVFTLIYWLADVKGHRKWAAFVRPAGRSSLTTYLAPDILYYTSWMLPFPVLVYKLSPNPLVVVLGSLAWALLMVGLTVVLEKLNIRLKL